MGFSPCHRQNYNKYDFCPSLFSPYVTRHTRCRNKFVIPTGA
jgi:hypothetical protein